MKLVIKKASNLNYQTTVDVDSIQDLFNLCESYGSDIIITRPRSAEDEYSLLVYDWYLE